jgi:NADH:ubiquinone oxidoreductase subunit K
MKEVIMSSLRKTSIAVGLIFVVATAAALLAALVDSILSGSSFLANIASSQHQIRIGVVFYVVAALTSASIPLAMYPVLKRKNAVLALGSVVFRSIEAVFYLIAVLCLQSLVTIGQNSEALSGNQQTTYNVVGNFLLTLREHATLLGVVAFCVGSLMYYYIFLRTRLIPLWLSVWGVLAAILMLVASALSLFTDNPITGYTILVFPIAVQEMVLALWLLARGFREKEAA